MLSVLAEKLIIFTRFPAAGTTKTRLIPALGAAGAADLQRRLSERIVQRGRELAARRGVRLEIWHAGGDPGQVEAWLGRDLRLVAQGGGDLGARMARAFAAAEQEDCRRVVLVGADCPALSVAILQGAFTALADHDLVLGPARDGGYYLLGLSCPASEIFQAQPWGENSLLRSTLACAARLGLATQLLEELADVDRPEDLQHLGDYPDLE
ncbi:MAG: glycosyltransferase [Desulfobulbaceae bacterium]|nr:glycosyltransferase [Desulfobulbaceae bacterium]